MRSDELLRNAVSDRVQTELPLEVLVEQFASPGSSAGPVQGHDGEVRHSVID